MKKILIKVLSWLARWYAKERVYCAVESGACLCQYCEKECDHKRLNIDLQNAGINIWEEANETSD